MRTKSPAENLQTAETDHH